MRLLLDTNIVIAHEDDDPARPHANSRPAAELVRRARGLGFELLISQGTVDDFLRAPEPTRSRRRRSLEKYYSRLDRVPVDSALRAVFPTGPLSANNQADLEILSALAAGAATALVTEDGAMRGRAKAAGLREVFSLEAALDWLRALEQPELVNAVAAELVAPYAIARDAPIFDSLRDDYPDFDDWWRHKVVDERRPVIVLGGSDVPDGIAVLKEELRSFGLDDRVLKICTFKVDEGRGRSRRGELLLRAVIDYAVERAYPSTYLTAWPHHEQLLGWLERFGFDHITDDEDGQRVMAKRLVPPPGVAPLDPLTHHVRYGPRALILDRMFVVPIKERYHARLLPDSEQQGSLLANEACGNAIRKAYLCRANTRQLRPGDTLAFLRTSVRTESRITAVGVVEDTLASTDPDRVAAFVAGRTVFSYDEIRALCQEGEVLAVLFRFDRSIDPPWPRRDLVANGVMNRPQSISIVPEEGVAWARQQLARTAP